MPRNFRFSCILANAFLLLSSSANGQDSIVLNGKHFVRSDSTWDIEYLGDRFKVDESSVTVKWKSGAAPRDIDTFLTNVGATVIRTNILGYVDLRIPRRGDFIPMLKRFINSDLVEIAEANSVAKPHSAYPPPRFANDPYRANQWYLSQANDVDIDITEAWGYSTGSPSVVVAVIDQGFDWRHEDIGKGTDSYENVWLNPGEDAWSNPNDPTTGNHIDDDGNGYIDDWKGWNFNAITNDCNGLDHGTFCAGIIGAKTNNNKGIEGIAGGWNGPGVKLLFTVIGGAHPESYDDAFLYAVSKGARVISISVGFDSTSAISAALQYAYDSGTVVVASAGNSDGQCADCGIKYPASYPSVIAVSGIHKDGSCFLSCGISPGAVSVSAGAGAKRSGWPDSTWFFSTFPSNGYGYAIGGTSFAAPQVAGVAALLFSLRPTLSPQQVRCILEKSADDIGTPGYDSIFGWGRLNAYQALKAVQILLEGPANNSTTLSLNPTLSWTQIFGATSYRVQVATNSNFGNPAYDQSGIATTYVTTPTLSTNTLYYWHVRPDNDLCNVAAWSETWQFTTPDDSGPPPDPTKTAVRLIGKPQVAYELVQNYPNPFNPLTVIGYRVGFEGYVSLKVYNMLGQEVATLVSQLREPAEYEVRWDASRLPSGIYTYRLLAGKFVDVKKMLLAR